VFLGTPLSASRRQIQPLEKVSAYTTKTECRPPQGETPPVLVDRAGTEPLSRRRAAEAPCRTLRPSGRFIVQGEVAPIRAGSDSYLTAEARARVEIDRQLAAAGWASPERHPSSSDAGLTQDGSQFAHPIAERVGRFSARQRTGRRVICWRVPIWPDRCARDSASDQFLEPRTNRCPPSST